MLANRGVQRQEPNRLGPATQASAYLLCYAHRLASNLCHPSFLKSTDVTRANGPINAGSILLVTSLLLLIAFAVTQCRKERTTEETEGKTFSVLFRGSILNAEIVGPVPTGRLLKRASLASRNRPYLSIDTFATRDQDFLRWSVLRWRIWRQPFLPRETACDDFHVTITSVNYIVSCMLLKVRRERSEPL